MITKYRCLMFFLIVGVTASGNAQWVRQYGGLPTTWGPGTSAWGLGLAMDACSPSVAIIAVEGVQPNVYLTKDAGAHFTPLTTPGAAADAPIDITIVDSLHVWYVNTTRIYASSDGGGSWQQQFFDTTTTPFLDYIRMFDLNNGVAVGDAPSGKPLAVLHTTDGGAQWSSVNTSGLVGMASGDIWRRIDFVSKTVGYIYTSFGGDNPQRIYKTTDGGTTWAPVFAKNGVMNLKFYDEQIGLVRGGYPSPQIYRTFNGGSTWDTIAVNNAQPGWGNDFEFLPGDPSRVWYTDYNNLLFSSDTGRTWVQQVIDTGKVFGRDIVFTDATHGWLLCDNGKLYHTVNGNQIVTSIERKEAITPSGFSLEQNYPNPFNPTTAISYQLSDNTFVSLKVFDMLGREIATLVDERKNAGFYQVEWNASGVSSGVYFYRLEAGGFIQAKKMVVIK